MLFHLSQNRLEVLHMIWFKLPFDPVFRSFISNLCNSSFAIDSLLALDVLEYFRIAPFLWLLGITSSHCVWEIASLYCVFGITPLVMVPVLALSSNSDLKSRPRPAPLGRLLVLFTWKFIWKSSFWSILYHEYWKFRTHSTWTWTCWNNWRRFLILLFKFLFCSVEYFKEFPPSTGLHNI